MRDIPMFTTEYGVASLILREIPYRQEAYIRVQTAENLRGLVDECATFCRMVGAQRAYATGHDDLQQYPLHTKILRMSRSLDGLADTDAMTIPVTEATLERWRSIYNEKMGPIPNSSYMDIQDAKKLLEDGNGYFVHAGGQLLGIGIASIDTVKLVAATQSGAGKDVLIALTHALTGDHVELEVASANEHAVRFYERLGFIKTLERSTWYRVL